MPVIAERGDRHHRSRNAFRRVREIFELAAPSEPVKSDGLRIFCAVNCCARRHKRRCRGSRPIRCDSPAARSRCGSSAAPARDAAPKPPAAAALRRSAPCREPHLVSWQIAWRVSERRGSRITDSAALFAPPGPLSRRLQTRHKTKETPKTRTRRATFESAESCEQRRGERIAPRPRLTGGALPGDSV